MHALIGKRKIMNQTNAKENIAAMNHSAILSMVITAICITLTYIFTAFINIRLPIAANGGLVHLGNVALFISAILFGKKTGAQMCIRDRSSTVTTVFEEEMCDTSPSPVVSISTAF